MCNGSHFDWIELSSKMTCLQGVIFILGYVRIAMYVCYIYIYIYAYTSECSAMQPCQDICIHTCTHTHTQTHTNTHTYVYDIPCYAPPSRAQEKALLHLAILGPAYVCRSICMSVCICIYSVTYTLYTLSTSPSAMNVH
jgi:hypothetical protein